MLSNRAKKLTANLHCAASASCQ